MATWPRPWLLVVGSAICTVASVAPGVSRKVASSAHGVLEGIPRNDAPLVARATEAVHAGGRFGHDPAVASQIPQRQWRKHVVRREAMTDTSGEFHQPVNLHTRPADGTLYGTDEWLPEPLVASVSAVVMPSGFAEIGIAPVAYKRPVQEFLLGVDEDEFPRKQGLTTNAGKISVSWIVPFMVGVPALCISTVIFVWLANRQDCRPHGAAARALCSIGRATLDRHAQLRRKAHCLCFEELERLAGTMLSGVRMSTAAHSNCGLEAEAVVQYQEIFGPNKMTPPEQENPWAALFKQIFGGLFNGLLWVCVAAQAFLALFAGEEMVTPIILAAVVVASATLQWWTEQKAQSMMKSLMNMQAAEDLTVFRRPSGERHLRPDELLPGDLVLLVAGMKVPADMRVLDCSDGALVDNSAVTGESVAEPRSATTAPESSRLMESRNILFSGTLVVEGRLLCLVTGTGDNTLLGDIAAKCRTARPRSSLEIQIEHFVHVIAVVAISVGFLSLAANYASPRKRSTTAIFRNTATAVFAQVPEGLLPTVTVSLMIAAERMRDHNVLVRKIDAIETLGCVNVLCSDKTGTLTSGSMTATDFVVPGHLAPKPEMTIGRFRTIHMSKTLKAGDDVELARLAEAGVLNTTAKHGDDGIWHGSPTEVAIGKACNQLLGAPAANALRETQQTVFDIPFSSATKSMLTIHAMPHNTCRLILKGASERVLDKCALTSDMRQELDILLEELMAQGKRVLCVAELLLADRPASFGFKGSGPDDANFPTTGYSFCGLVAIEDPPKDGVSECIAKFGQAGGVTVMVTGDHPSTARAIAKRIGIMLDGEPFPPCAETYRVITGETLEQHEIVAESFDPSAIDMDFVEAEQLVHFWEQCVKYTRVFARVSPMHKRAIVRAYQHLGSSIVAMTGDGVNDAPALKEAEVGIAMGIRGTEVAQEAADIILLDDDLRSVVAGIEQGRLCSENLRKSIKYTLCSKIPQLVPNFAEAFAVPTALTAVQVLLIDIGTDIWTAIAYAWQQVESSLMTMRPRHPRHDRMVNRSVLLYSYIYIGALQMAMCWFLFFKMPRMMDLFKERKRHAEYDIEDLQAQDAGSTMYYWALVCGQVGAGLATTTSQLSLFQYGLPNWRLNLCIIAEVIVGVVCIYWKPANDMFKTRPLEVKQFLQAFCAIIVIVLVEEVRKAYLRRMHSMGGCHDA